MKKLKSCLLFTSFKSENLGIHSTQEWMKLLKMLNIVQNQRWETRTNLNTAWILNNLDNVSRMARRPLLLIYFSPSPGPLPIKW